MNNSSLGMRQRGPALGRSRAGRGPRRGHGGRAHGDAARTAPAALPGPCLPARGRADRRPRAPRPHPARQGPFPGLRAARHAGALRACGDTPPPPVHGLAVPARALRAPPRGFLQRPDTAGTSLGLAHTPRARLGASGPCLTGDSAGLRVTPYALPCSVCALGPRGRRRRLGDVPPPPSAQGVDPRGGQLPPLPRGPLQAAGAGAQVRGH